MTDVREYDYRLPHQLIAQHPAPNRADARLMVVRRETRAIEHVFVRDLDEVLSPGDVVVLNDSRVIPARLIGRRTFSGGRWEGLYLHTEADGRWRLICKCRGKLQPGESITLIDNRGRDDVRLALLEKDESGQWLARPLLDRDTLDVLNEVGRVPLPCYIRSGEMLPCDRARYQTVYSNRPGSVAAPTAGLHFTQSLLQRLAARGINTAYVTLHIGLGTFRPIEAQTVEQHVMHEELGEVSDEAAACIESARQAGGRVIPVGTTSMRLLETAARDGSLQAFRGATGLFIRPGYKFQIADGLLTNFHLPRSTLLVLVQTFGGDDLIRRAYQEAIREEYRFYSYGDAMLIL